MASSVSTSSTSDELARDVRIYVFGEAVASGVVPQPNQIASALGRSLDDVKSALRTLASGKVLILAPNSDNIWAANPFCAVPSPFRVKTDDGHSYSGICVWDALGVIAAVGRDAVLDATCGDCGDEMSLEVKGGSLTRSEGVIHFGVPAHHWWDNIGFT